MNDMDEQFAAFVQIIAHDIQAPVKKIISFLDLFKTRVGENMDEKSREYIQRIDKNAATLTVLMKKLTDYARYSSVSDAPTQVDLNKVVAKVKAERTDLFSVEKAIFEVSSLPSLRGRPLHLERLFLNLFENAVRYKRDPVSRIRVSATRKGPYWEIAVSDHGKGIKPEYLQKIFSIFPRSEDQETPSTGVGLAIAKKIVENHGGKLWAESVPGQGSTFLFTLPA